MGKYTVELKITDGMGQSVIKKCSMDNVERDLGYGDGQLLNELYYEIYVELFSIEA